MSGEFTPNEISYFEYRVINRIVHAHAEDLKGALRAMIAFGDLKTVGGTYDIDLLEVIEDWKEKDRVAEFNSSPTLPMRGKLRLYFLSSSEFENPGQIEEEAMRRWVEDLLKRVRAGYEIILEYPSGYARNVLERGLSISALTAPASGALQMSDPLKLPVRSR